MTHLQQGLIALLLVGSPLSGVAQDGIVIQNVGKIIPHKQTYVDAGPTDPASGINTGNILNFHFYPGIAFYTAANYKYAKDEMDYVIARPTYIENNPRQREILSVAHFIRGMIYFRHASGMGRLGIARTDLEQAVQWNPENHVARLELARLAATLDKKAEAIAMLTNLLEANLTPRMRVDVEKDLESLKSGQFKANTKE